LENWKLAAVPVPLALPAEPDPANVVTAFCANAPNVPAAKDAMTNTDRNQRERRGTDHSLPIRVFISSIKSRLMRILG
jgi:hypothetical protein